MAIMRWAPFSAFTSLEREMHDMLNRFSVRPWLEGFDWKPTVDVFKKDGELIVRAELPGVDRDDIEIDLEGNVLHVKGEKRFTHEVSDDEHYVHEASFGSFRRDMMLPDGVDFDAIEAVFENGILELHIPVPIERPEASKARKVPIKTPEHT